MYQWVNVSGVSFWECELRSASGLTGYCLGVIAFCWYYLLISLSLYIMMILPWLHLSYEDCRDVRCFLLPQVFMFWVVKFRSQLFRVGVTLIVHAELSAKITGTGDWGSCFNHSYLVFNEDQWYQVDWVTLTIHAKCTVNIGGIESTNLGISEFLFANRAGQWMMSQCRQTC